ncbi:MAG: histidinol-phosphate transaminase [Alphaproteobacteria bacterium]|jgi:histidinol-phosphate aminotransferase|nr:histidinol-phosphate transaminase [Alphaproteobacteria bacterium]
MPGQPEPRPRILEISPYVGGRASIDGQENAIKLSSNESALGPSPRALEAYRAQGDLLARYPDGGASELREALGALHRLDPERIVCGAGSDELLQLLCKAYAGPGDEVLFTEHGFLVYRLATLAAGATPVAVPETDLCANVDAILNAVGETTRIVFLANPNNPTGSYLPRAELRRLWEGLPSSVLLVVDAAYAEFVSPSDYDPGIELVDAAENVIMTRTFSKIYALASLRLGWAYGPPAIIGVLNRVRGPFNVSGAALAAGVAAVGDQAHIDRARAHNDKWLAKFSAAMADIGVTCVPSVGNFVLLRFSNEPGRDAQAADNFLGARGIIARDVTNYGLPDYLRLSIGLDQEMETVIQAMTDFTRRS